MEKHFGMIRPSSGEAASLPQSTAIMRSHIYRRSESVVTREIAGETLLVPITGKLADMENLFCLNETGAFVWNQLDGGTPLETICAGITEAFEVDDDRAWPDLDKLISDLLQAELISEEPSE
jgi:hypothetical protein